MSNRKTSFARVVSLSKLVLTPEQQDRLDAYRDAGAFNVTPRPGRKKNSQPQRNPNKPQAGKSGGKA